MKYLDEAKFVFETEITSLIEVKDKLLKSDVFPRIIESILNAKGRCVVTGMGKSGLVGKKITATLASTGTRSFFMHPGEAYHGDLGMIHSGDVIIAISNSGETEEIIRLIPFFKENGNKVIAMTGKKDSTLNKHSDFFLDVGVSKEACLLELAPTSSTTVTMAMGDAIAISLMKARNFKAENFAKFHPGGSLGRKLLTRVSDLMRTKDLPIIEGTDSFDKILSTISHGRLGVGVILENNELKGIITDGDIRRILKKEKEKALDMTAKDFGYKEPIVVSEAKKIAFAENIMQENKIINLVVVSSDGHFRGILSRYDI